jgi:DNA polymerase-3 subunit epsilon
MVVDMFMELWAGRHRVAHNEKFDARLVRIALKRFSDPRYPALAIKPSDEWKESRAECTAILSSPILDLAPTAAMKEKAKGFKRKTPTMKEAYEHLLGRPLEDAHNAMADARACVDVYFAIKDLEQRAA